MEWILCWSQFNFELRFFLSWSNVDLLGRFQEGESPVSYCSHLELEGFSVLEPQQRGSGEQEDAEGFLSMRTCLGDLLLTVSPSFSSKESKFKGGLPYFMETREGINPPLVSLLGETLGEGAPEPHCWLERCFLIGTLTANSNPLKPKLSSSRYKFRARYGLGQVF